MRFDRGWGYANRHFSLTVIRSDVTHRCEQSAEGERDGWEAEVAVTVAIGGLAARGQIGARQLRTTGADRLWKLMNRPLVSIYQVEQTTCCVSIDPLTVRNEVLGLRRG